MLKSTWTMGLKCLLVCAVMTAVFTLSMFLVFLIPDSAIQNNASKSIEMLQHEGENQISQYKVQLDTGTSSMMIEHSLKKDSKNAITAAMVPSYSRYWHGYIVVLRPLLIVAGVQTIEGICLYALTLLAFAIFYFLNKKVGLMPAISFVLASISVRALDIVPACLQYMGMFIIAYLFALVVLLAYDTAFFKKNSVYMFLVVGALTSFIDFLTAPLITLGIPLACLLLLLLRSEDSRLSHAWRVIFSHSAGWGMGYALCWAAKWPIGSIILRENVLANAAQEIAFRTAGEVVGRATGLAGLRETNIFYMIIPLSLLLFTAILIFTYFGIKKVNAPFKNALRLLPLLAVACYPYLWYIFTANHSAIHYPFTYRIQMITIFAGWSVLLQCAKAGFVKLKK